MTTDSCICRWDGCWDSNRRVVHTARTHWHRSSLCPGWDGPRQWDLIKLLRAMCNLNIGDRLLLDFFHLVSSDCRPGDRKTAWRKTVAKVRGLLCIIFLKGGIIFPPPYSSIVLSCLPCSSYPSTIEITGWSSLHLGDPPGAWRSRRVKIFRRHFVYYGYTGDGSEQETEEWGSLGILKSHVATPVLQTRM